jgi:hypothetical protein
MRINHLAPPVPPYWLNRRDFLGHMGEGLTGVALAVLLNEQGLLVQNSEPSGKPHFAPQAKRVIQIFCPGAVSAMDTFEYKPELQKRSGEPLPGGENLVSFQAPTET